MKSSIRKSLARLRTFVSSKGVDLKPLSDRSGKYAGFAIEWKSDPDLERGAISTVRMDGVVAQFFVNDERDMIQLEHMSGNFYEPEELEIIRRNFEPGIFVDVGANVGNHAVFVGKTLSPEHIVAFEPNPPARRSLLINLALNGLQASSTVHPFGLSNSPQTASLSQLAANNIGSMRVDQSGQGLVVSLARGDDLLGDGKVSFIKIDVEGHELQALQGLEQTLLRWKPVVFVEVEDENSLAVNTYIEELGYTIAERFSRHGGRENLLLKAIEP